MPLITFLLLVRLMSETTDVSTRRFRRRLRLRLPTLIALTLLIPLLPVFLRLRSSDGSKTSSPEIYETTSTNGTGTPSPIHLPADERCQAPWQKTPIAIALSVVRSYVR